MRFETEYLLGKRLEMLSYEAEKKPDQNKKPCGTCRFVSECIENLKKNSNKDTLTVNPDKRLCIQAYEIQQKGFL